MVFTGFSVLLSVCIFSGFSYSHDSDDQVSQAVISLRGSQDILVNLFERIKNFFVRLETYIEVQPTMGMTDIIVKIMVQVLSILAIATREIKQSRASE